MQVKNLNEILRESAILNALGEDIQLYLLTLLADQRGHNIRNMICHGFATPLHLNQQMADRILHALLTLALVRERPNPSAQTSAGATKHRSRSSSDYRAAVEVDLSGRVT